jgi:hypothetical protein
MLPDPSSLRSVGWWHLKQLLGDVLGDFVGMEWLHL